MRKIESPQEFRNNIAVKLNDILDDLESCKNLEKGIYNYSLDHATRN